MQRLLFLLFATITLGATAQPHLSGTVTINMKEGIIDCDFKLSHMPALTAYRVLLNKGMNIQQFTSDSNRQLQYDGYYNGKMRGESIEYILLKNANDSFFSMPSAFGVKYRGAFPVYADTFNVFDFKGFIAFNGKTLRAAEQSKWYPVIYDAANDRLIEQYSYDITVIAKDSKTVFINGSMPQQKPVARFVSAVPRELLLFAGEYDFVESRGNYILNANVDSSTAGKIFRELDRIKSFHAKNLGITYNENIYLVSHRAVEKYGPSRSWGFTSFPSFAYAGLNFSKLVNEQGHFDHGNTAFFAHELSHYYFGSNMLSGKLLWFWLESTTEYLSLKASEAFTDTAFYNGRVRRYANFLSKQKYKPLAKIMHTDEIDSDYRYVYGPLLLLCFEKQFGPAITYKLLADIIKRSEKQTITLEIFRDVALANKIKLADWENYYNTYLNSDDAIEKVCRSVLASLARK